jgi:aspartyl/asparaginyl beta-hydroxylase (cupin superfamily)
MFIDARTGDFQFIRELEESWRVVRDECAALPANGFEPWVQREMYGDGWSVYGLIAFGQRIDAALAGCPRTAALLERVPRLTTAGFSRLQPGTHIAPHVGWVKTVYRAHLGLVVPPDCGMRVGDETRKWRDGECLVFDDTVEHEAWNRSERTRTVLLFDFVRPGLADVAADVPPPEVRAMLARQRR